MGIPFVIVGLLLSVIGYTIYNRSDSDRIRNVYAYDLNPGELKEKEIPRMELVLKNFVRYRTGEIIIGLAGIALFFFFRKQTDSQFWSGLGLGFFIMALLALGADYFAEKRGHVYLKGLKEFTQQPR
jgi:hypothetical protein